MSMMSVEIGEVFAVVSFVGGAMEIALFDEREDAMRALKFTSQPASRPQPSIMPLKVRRTSYRDGFADEPRFAGHLGEGKE
jgi:hypothetical protein